MEQARSQARQAVQRSGWMASTLATAALLWTLESGWGTNSSERDPQIRSASDSVKAKVPYLREPPAVKTFLEPPRLARLRRGPRSPRRRSRRDGGSLHARLPEGPPHGAESSVEVRKDRPRGGEPSLPQPAVSCLLVSDESPKGLELLTSSRHLAPDRFHDLVEGYATMFPEGPEVVEIAGLVPGPGW